ncbi:LppA family lipoprotein [Thermocrispum agreste]|uniref:LppA family lipoprotein n=1 Tax=Thermocrispum agreste TaxID=37925 RepID=UPI0003FD60A4|nr:LppA family lipoprotein [Thermocrispum agreste]
MSPEEQFAELMSRPDTEQARQLYERMQARIRAALSERLGLGAWETDPATASEAPCGDFPDVHPFNASTFGMPLWFTMGPLEPEQWQAAKQVLRDVTGEHGFRQVVLDVDGPVSRVFQLSDGKGAAVRLMVNPQDRVVLRVDAGCHLKPEVKRLGRPLNEVEKEQYRQSRHRAGGS